MELKTRVVKSVGWYAAARLTARGTSWVVTILVARFLTPADYGLFVMALTVTAAVEMVQEFGLGTAIIRLALTREQLNTIFWFVFSVSALVTGVLFLAAPLAAAFYGEPRLTWAVRACALTFPLHAIGLVPYSLLTKAIDFRRRSLAEAVGVLTSATVALALASLGFGVWSLVLAVLAEAAVRNLLMTVTCGWRPGVRITSERFREILTFGCSLAVATVIRSITPIVSRAIVGRLLGGPALGFFSMAESIADGPQVVSSAVVQQLSLPIFAELQSNDDELRRYFTKIAKYMFVLAMPMQVGIAVVAPDLVPVLLGPQWQPAVGVVQILSLAALFYVPTVPAASLLMARGRASTILRFNIVSALVQAGCVLAGASFGLIGVALAWFVSFSILRLALLRLALREIGVTSRQYGGAGVHPAAATLVMAVAVLAVGSSNLLQGESALRVVVQIIVGALLYPALLLLIDRGLGGELRGIVLEMFARSRPRQAHS